jgi:hypothetical protein
VIAAVLAVLLALQEPPSKKPAPPPPPKLISKEDPLSMDRVIRPILQRHCYRCHNNERQKGGVNLFKDDNTRVVAENRKTWQVALDMVERKLMPPEDATAPSEEHRKLLADFIRKTLGALDCEKTREPGKPVVRRLNRVEYDQSVLDLTGLDLKLAADFSPDANAHGFDNNAEALAMSPVLVEQYHAAGRKLLDALAKDPAAKSRVLAGPADRDGARRVVERFATRAFRRPADPDFLDKLLGLYDKARARGDAHERACEPMLLAVLISPRFLLRIESHKPDEKGSYPVDDYDLASRLSFFLWSGPPDDVLLAAAAKGELRTADQAEAQARRMLAHPRGRSLAEHFVGQWLQLRNLAAHKPDARVFPEFSESLRTSMKRELDLFLDEVIRKDRPLTELLDADYTYLNEELAKHYGIPGVTGPEHRRVALTDRRRGGLLTSATVLMVQSDPDRTNIPRRGNYIAGSILGMPPPPPPPDVPPLEETKATETVVTLRQRFELHRSKPDCAGCHVKIDPLGFAFENYDALGRWREKDGGAPVDASGVLPNGRIFKGPEELKRILVGRREEFTRTLAENLLIYALGRSLQLEDECVVRDAVKAAAANEHRFSAVVYSLVRSHPFRHRRNPEY